MKLYTEVPIESVEDAQKLSVGTIIYKSDEYGEVIVGSKIGGNTWRTTDYTSDGWDYLDRHIVGWIALVEMGDHVVSSLTDIVADRSEFKTIEEVRRGKRTK